MGPVKGEWGRGGKNQGGEIRNKINTHKSKVIHGHRHQDWERHSEPEVIHSGSRLGARRLVGTKRVMDSVSGKGETRPRSSLVASAH